MYHFIEIPVKFEENDELLEVSFLIGDSLAEEFEYYIDGKQLTSSEIDHLFVNNYNLEKKIDNKVDHLIANLEQIFDCD